MFKRSSSIVTAAAVTMLGSGVFLMAQSTPDTAVRQPNNDPTPAGQANVNHPNAPTGQNGQAAQQGNNASGMETNRQINAELRQFAQDPKTAPDKLFVLNAYLDSSMEIQYSQQALGKTQDARIKDLANHMIADHTKLNGQLQQVAQQLNVELPQGTPTMKQSELDVIGSLSGKDYDQQYLGTMNADHAKAIACFEFAAANSQNAQVKQAAQEAVPTLRQHREMVRQVAAADNVTLGDNAGNEATPAAAHLHGQNGAQLDNGGGGTTPPGGASGGSQR
jgi:predicted outer membrane protein